MKHFKIRTWLLFVVAILLFVYALSVILLPDDLFPQKFSTAVFDRNGILLGARLAPDEQWRFPSDGKVPDKYEKALLTYEDQHFYHHPGINVVSIFNSMIDNIQAGEIIRGGSTLSMQVVRMSRQRKGRSFVQKFVEMFLTLGLEARYSKSEILDLYASNAPMGGNVIGLKAASWRYFGHADHQLSWAEAATLAVLPNAPGLIHPGYNHDKLLEKRNMLLKALMEDGTIDTVQYRLALIEKIPGEPLPLPSVASHFVEYISRKFPGKETYTTIDYHLQCNIVEIAKWHTVRLNEKGVGNAAVLVADPANNEVLAYLGNLPDSEITSISGFYNDMVTSVRSTGSILKPFLYAAMNKDGLILPNSLVPDIPSYFDDYHPHNYNEDYQGAIPASMALSRSLNVPAVYMLQRYGISRFLELLKRMGFTSFTKSSAHYGLTLILGGGEVSLFELTGAYSGMAGTLLSYENGSSFQNCFTGLRCVRDEERDSDFSDPPLNPGAIWLTYEALNKVKRPASEVGWENFLSAGDIAWKTGTSHGFKDAWAVGTTADYVVGVWAGNADGRGVAGLSGTKTAAPLMFDVFNSLETKNSFNKPYGDLKEVEVCAKSGMLASRFCPDKVKIDVSRAGRYSNNCKYHRLIFTDSTKQYRMSQKCVSVSELNPVVWFVLPPVQEYYYSRKHPLYKPLPSYAPGCETEDQKSMAIVYPVEYATIYVVRDETGSKKEIVFEARHHNQNASIFWHLDNQMIGVTTGNHKIAVIPASGQHTLTLVDENGESISRTINVVN